MPIITLPKTNKTLSADAGTNLPDVLKENGIYPDALCLGAGGCRVCWQCIYEAKQAGKLTKSWVLPLNH